MKSHPEIQRCIKTAVQEAIWRAGQVEGAEEVALTNTDVVEALLEVVGVWSAVHGFEDYAPVDLALKHAMTITRHIERYRPIIQSGTLPFEIVPRRKIN